MKVLQVILRNLDEYRRLFYIVAIASVINGVASFYIPVTLAGFANDPLVPGNFGWTITVIVALYVLSLVTSYIVRGKGEALAKKFANHMRLNYFRQLSALPIERLRKKHSGYVQSLVNKVSDGMEQIIFEIFWQLLPGVLLVVLFFVYIARESVALAVFNLVIMTIFVVISSLLSRKMVPIAAEQNRRNAALLGGFADFMANITTVAQLGVRPYAQNVLHSHAGKSNQKIDDLQRFHARRWFLLHALFGLAFMLTISFLVWQIADGTAKIGLLILFVSAYGMLRSLIERLSENIKSFMEMRAYLQELDDFIGEAPTSTRPKNDWRRIVFKNIEFQYPDNQDVVKVPEFSIVSGQKVCIEGKSGQGKSTFLGLLTNALRPQSGVRHVDDEVYDDIGREFFARNVAVISQEAELFHLSVRDNLTLGKHMSDEELLRYVDELELRDWYEGLEKGFDSLVGEKGVTLSAGQRQRVNILRGILLDRSFYILDEPTSHLDAHTEEITVAFLERYLAKKSAVIVTHRPALERICDTSFEMKNHTLTPKV